MGAVQDALNQLRAQHDDLNESLATTDTTRMPDVRSFGRREMPIRSMYYQLVAHITEHTVQIIKTHQMLGLNRSEAQLILAQLQHLHGALEGLLIGVTDEEFEREPEGEWSIKQTFDHMLTVENRYRTLIGEALAAEAPAT